MPVTKWLARHAGQEYGAGPEGATSALAHRIAGEGVPHQRYTYYGKPYVLRPDDPQAVYDYFDSEIDPHGEREVLVWEYQPDPDPDGAVP